MKSIPEFYKSESDFQKIHHRLKQYPCPHCDEIGTLNLHGVLKGFSANKGNNKIIRGQRIYCSNRGQRPGCGKTFSIMISTLFKKYILTTGILWEYLKHLAKGKNIFQAFDCVKSIFTISTVYRLIKAVILNQSKIRMLLLNKHVPPKKIKTNSPLIQTIQHLQLSFPGQTNPISAFQIYFQTSFI